VQVKIGPDYWRSLDTSQFLTPFYLYQKSQFLRNYRALKAALGTDLFVSIKANSDFDRLVDGHADEIDGLEAASEPELTSVLQVAQRSKIYVNSPAMQLDLLDHAVKAEVNIVVDSAYQLEILSQLGADRLKPVILRLNSSSFRFYGRENAGLKEDHFGMDLESLPALRARAKQLKIAIRGFHVFHGSYTFFERATYPAEAWGALVHHLESILGHTIEFFNLGGGFSPEWSENAQFDWVGYRKKLTSVSPSMVWAHESGRAVFSSAGYFVVRVISTKLLNGKLIAVCDGGIAQNFLLAKTENPLRKYQSPEIVKASAAVTEICNYPIVYVGSSCSQNDIIGKSSLPSVKPEPGDWAIFSQCGAYNSSYTMPSFLALGAANRYFD
jgi:diaminopimelate decarboxylase